MDRMIADLDLLQLVFQKEVGRDSHCVSLYIYQPSFVLHDCSSKQPSCRGFRNHKRSSSRCYDIHIRLGVW